MPPAIIYMKKQSFYTSLRIIMLTTFITGLAVAANAQTFTPAKVATINSSAFLDEKVGITRLVKAYAALNIEFKPRQEELVRINAQIAKLTKEIQDLQSSANNPAANQNVINTQINAKTDEGSWLEIDFKRKQEDAKVAFEKREKSLTGPIMLDLSNAVDAYAKKTGIDVIIDLSKTDAVYAYSTASNITTAFIADFNAKPVTP